MKRRYQNRRHPLARLIMLEALEHYGYEVRYPFNCKELLSWRMYKALMFICSVHYLLFKYLTPYIRLTFCHIFYDVQSVGAAGLQVT